MSKKLTYPIIQDYLTALIPERDPEMLVMEKYAEEHDFPIIGPAAGYNCYQIARMIQAKSIFEMGSGYGYSTAWFAKAVKENGGGQVHHTVWDEKLSKMAASHLSRLGYEGMIKFHMAEAVETLRNMPGTFDIIFNDIDKEAYPSTLPIIKAKLKPGGVLIIDNMLWGGRIFDQTEKSSSTEGVREFTKIITTDPDWIVSLIPVRDGMIVAYKK
ncbi:MAG: O-methyltransferase [Anaerolineae bacterium]|nr:O-methyltransferase [Anaerolineae bacterium]MDK1079992.1 O-methyltransferase [Anaerolineae bacterium]MDK1117219.1 O-methyltransferase [Anaerolineae bacterium]